MARGFLIQFLYVGVGGFCGAGLRFALGTWVQRALPAATFPYGTLAVNVLGCLLIGFIAAWRQPLEPALRLLLITGLLGGFTTFSAFALETLTLTHQGQQAVAFINIAAQLVLSLAAAWTGFELGRLLNG